MILLVYGLAIAAGNVIGGKAANRKPMNALFYMFALQAAILLVLTFTAPFKAPALITIIFMGLLAFMNVPGLQSYVVILADRYAPGARDIASAVNIAAFNAGIAIGAYLGGFVTEHLGLIHTAWVGSVMVLGAVVLTARSRSLERSDEQAPRRQTA
ncbi:Purine efflux pump PbuE [compost metagenome]